VVHAGFVGCALPKNRDEWLDDCGSLLRDQTTATSPRCTSALRGRIKAGTHSHQATYAVAYVPVLQGGGWVVWLSLISEPLGMHTCWCSTALLTLFVAWMTWVMTATWVVVIVWQHYIPAATGAAGAGAAGVFPSAVRYRLDASQRRPPWRTQMWMWTSGGAVGPPFRLAAGTSWSRNRHCYSYSCSYRHRHRHELGSRTAAVAAAAGRVWS
jgi:hypothetical protein